MISVHKAPHIFFLQYSICEKIGSVAKTKRAEENEQAPLCPFSIFFDKKTVILIKNGFLFLFSDFQTKYDIFLHRRYDILKWQSIKDAALSPTALNSITEKRNQA
ncbi:MAG: hypothetical protein DBY04_03645 [Clostridiales bacterium]|nr:MAG: hypothetical protein DBY04_03645 [Clostridiales bacterium]